MLSNFVNVQYCYNYLIDQIPVNLLLYSHIPTALIALIFGTFVYLKDKSRTSINLFIICVAFALWCIFDISSWFSFIGSANTMYVWTLLFLSGLIIFLFSYYFLYTFITKKDLPNWQKISGVVLLLPMVVWTFLGSSLLSYDGNSCVAVENNLVTTYYYIVQFIVLLASIALTIIQSIRTKEISARKQVIFSGVGVVTFLLFFFSSTLLVSWLGETDASSYVYNYEIYGLFGMPILLGFLGYLIVRFKAFNIRLFGAQALVIGLAALIASKIFTAEAGADRTITYVTLGFVGVFGYYLVKSVKKEIETREKIEKLATELEVANDRLRELDKQKSEFVSIASHQLRAPLTAIKGYLSMILEGDYGEVNAQLKEMIERTFESANNLVTIVSDFLDVSRIEQGRMVYDWKDFDLKPLVETVVHELTQPAQKRGLEFGIEVESGVDYKVHGDQGKLKQVFTNLVDNSIKYTPKGSVKILLSRPSPRTVRFAVKDTGVGVDKETISRLFEKFSRAKDATQTNAIGTGLGLFVAKEMIKAHEGGKIWVESEGKDKGSTFIVELKGL